MPRLLALLLAATLAGSEFPQDLTTAKDPELRSGIALVREGDFEAALPKLDEAVRRISAVPQPDPDLAAAYLYLGIAYLELDQELLARAKFRQALGVAPGLRLDPGQFSAQVIRVFETTRESLRSEPAATPTQPARKKRSAVPYLLIGGGAAAAGIALATGGGGGGSNPATTTTTTQPAVTTTTTTTTTTGSASGLLQLLDHSGEHDAGQGRRFGHVPGPTESFHLRLDGREHGGLAADHLRPVRNWQWKRALQRLEERGERAQGPYPAAPEQGHPLRGGSARRRATFASRPLLSSGPASYRWRAGAAKWS